MADTDLSLTSSHPRVMDIHYSHWKKSILVTSSDTEQHFYTKKADDHRNHTITNSSNQIIGSACVHQ